MVLGTALVELRVIALAVLLHVFESLRVGARHRVGNAALELEPNVGTGDIGRRKARDLGPGLLASLRRVLDDAEIERVTETRGDTGRLKPHFQAIDAHVALLDPPLYGIELRRVVRAHPRAV